MLVGLTRVSLSFSSCELWLLVVEDNTRDRSVGDEMIIPRNTLSSVDTCRGVRKNNNRDLGKTIRRNFLENWEFQMGKISKNHREMWEV